MTNEHHDYIESDVSEYGDAQSQCDVKPKSDVGPGWHREAFLSFWAGQQLELIVLQNGGSSENWKWTARGWRRPDEGDGADEFGWLEETSRAKAEAAAIRWYMQKDE